ncbi:MULTISPECIES: M81 family metallopeptidase [Amycolatopsis]|uniref:M81 family metallopeptidase n=1 Tax=Amycolatopsis dongchuanensis TaxID=1070866 RepID=A0ABP8VL59_9PSEU
MRFAALGLYHEANTFSAIKADRALFESGGVFRGAQILDQYQGSATILGGYLDEADRLGIDLVPLFFARVNPVGPITNDVFEDFSGEMLDQLQRHGPWDGVLLALHGAAVSEDFPDADAELAARIRTVLGPDVPVGVVLDMHANLSPRLVDAVTVTLVYQTNPHVDAYDRAIDCTRLVHATAKGASQPKQALVTPPLVVDIARQDTGELPMRDLVAAAARARQRPEMLSASIVQGFPYADVPAMGMSFLAISDGNEAMAQQVATELAELAWSRREELRGQGLTVTEALELAERTPEGPVVLLDVGDNIGGGAPGDSTVILAEAQRRETPSLLQTLWDPDAAEQCRAAGVGAEITLAVGARHPHSAGRPVTVTGRVRHLGDGRFEETRPVHGGFRFYDMGPTAVLETTDGHTLVLMSRQTANTSRQQFLSLGLNPEDHHIVVAKGVNAPRAAYAPIARELVLVDTDGIAALGLHRFDYRRRRKPLYPLEPDATF